MRMFLAKVREFYADTSGSIVIISGMAIIVLLGFAGVAVDVGVWYTIKRTAQVAVDAAALAGAHEMGNPDATDTDIETAALLGAQKNGFSSANGDDVQVTILPNDEGVQVAVTRQGPLFFSAVIMSDIPTIAASAVAAPKLGSIELALVLDVSGSMNKPEKIGVLRVAAQDLIDILYGSEETLPYTWIAVIPFSGRVNIVDYGSTWMMNPGSGDAGHLCVGLRSMPPQANDATPSVELFPDYIQPTNKKGNKSKSTCVDAKALALTAEKTTIKNRIAGLMTTHGTSTQRGMVWGWRALSPEWKGLWGDPDLPNPYDGPIPKVVVIMTDGKNHPEQSGDPFTEDGANQLLLQECTAMKANDITIFAVVFDVKDPALFQLYTDCASPDKAFDAQDSDALYDAFQQIGGELRVVRLTQ